MNPKMCRSSRNAFKSSKPTKRTKSNFFYILDLMNFKPECELMFEILIMCGVLVRYIGLLTSCRRKRWNGWLSSIKNPIKKKNFPKIHPGSLLLDFTLEGKTFPNITEENWSFKTSKKTSFTPYLTITMSNKKNSNNEKLNNLW